MSWNRAVRRSEKLKGQVWQSMAFWWNRFCFWFGQNLGDQVEIHGLWKEKVLIQSDAILVGRLLLGPHIPGSYMGKLTWVALECLPKKVSLNVDLCIVIVVNLELVSKELNHFGVIAGLFRQIGGHSSRFVLFGSFWRLFTIKMMRSVKVFPFSFWK